MPHARKRYLIKNLQKALRFSGVVGVIGHRQSGKTTLVSEINEHYLTFDIKKLRHAANQDPDQFLGDHITKNSTLILDEVQLVPDLFPAIKEMVRVNPRPGQFLLTGSVRFTSRKAIRESLTGRIVNLELLPFSLAELTRQPLPNISKTLIESIDIRSFLDSIKSYRSPIKKYKNAYQSYFKNGGLPGVCFIRDPKLQALRIEEQLKTILDRDLRLVYSTNLPYIQLIDLLEKISQLHGRALDYTHLKNETDLSTPTIKKLISALESVFLIRLLPISGGRKGMIALLEDQAESRHLAGSAIDPYWDYVEFIYRNVRTEFFYDLGEKYHFFHYLTKNGSSVPFAVNTPKGALGYYPTRKEQPSHAELMSAQSFLRKNQNSKIVFLHPDAEQKEIDPKMVILPDSIILWGSI